MLHNIISFYIFNYQGNMASEIRHNYLINHLGKILKSISNEVNFKSILDYYREIAEMVPF